MNYIESSRADSFNPKFDLIARLSSESFPQLQGESISRATFIQRHLSQVTLSGCTFTLAQILGSTFDRCRFFDCAFLATEINGVDFLDCIFRGVMFKTTTLRNTRFEGCTFEDCHFESETGEAFQLSDCLSFREAIFTRTKFSPAIPKELLKSSWTRSDEPAPVEEVQPVAVIAEPASSKPEPIAKAFGDGRFASLEL